MKKRNYFGFTLMSMALFFAYSCGSGGANDVKIEKIKAETVDLSTFEVKASAAIKGGWNLNATNRCRNVTVNFANYEEIDKGPYGVTAPGESGQKLIQIIFNGISTPASDAILPVKEGEFKPTNSGASPDDQQFYVVVFEGGNSRGYSLTTKKSEGSATISKITDNEVCGTINVVDENGFELKTEFCTSIYDDSWKNVK